MDTDEQETGNQQPLSLAAISALGQGKKIEAIRLFRGDRQIGLKEAKNIVEDYIRTQPLLRDSFAAAQAKAKLNALLLLVLAVIVWLVAYWFGHRGAF